MSYTSSNPFWWARISSYSRKAGSPNIIDLGKGRGPNDIVSFSFSKSITGGGSLNLVLVPGRHNYFDLILPNSAVEFWVDGGDGRGPCMFVAYVNRISLTRSAGGSGVEDQRILISCSDATRVFNDLRLFFSGYMKGFEGVFANMGVIRAIQAGKRAKFSKGNKKVPARLFLTPPEFLVFFLAAWMEKPKANTVKALLPNVATLLPNASGTGENFVNTIDFATGVFAPKFFWPFARYVRMSGGSSNVGSLWSLLNTYSHALFNELFIDCRPLKEFKYKSGIDSSRGNWGSDYDFSLRRHFTEETDSLISSVARASSQDNSFNPQDYSLYFGSANPGGKEEWAQRLIMRPRPYLSSDLRRLYRYEVSAMEVTNFDLGFSVSNAYNYFRVSPTWAGGVFDSVPFDKMMIGIMNLDSVTRLGLKRFEPTTAFMLPIDLFNQDANKGLLGKLDKNSSILKCAAYQSNLIALTHYRNDSFLNGSITFPSVRPDFRVGNALLFDPGIHTARDVAGTHDPCGGTFPDHRILFYIETITHSATADVDSSTSLGLVRGRPLDSKEDALENGSALKLDSVRGGALQDPGPGLTFIKLGQNIVHKK